MIPALLALAAWAADPAVTAVVHGDIRFLGALPPDFVVDDEGTSVGQGAVLDERIRLSLGLEFRGGWDLSTEWDLATGQIAGDTWDISGSEDERRRDVLKPQTTPRRLAMRGLLEVVQIEAGLMTSQWGLGLVANDGAAEPLFGRSDLGDRVLRFRATTRPFKRGGEPLPLYLAFATDQVIADDTARWSADQSAVQAIVAALWADTSGNKAGVYLVYRNQHEAEITRSSDVAVLDGYVDVPVPVGAWTLRLAGEGAGIVGRTERTVTYVAPEGPRVAQLGLVGRAELHAPDDRVVAHLRTGYASATGDPDGKVVSDFTADRNFDVGMVMFDEGLGAIEAATYAIVTDPAHAGRPPDGADALVTEGSFRRAAYVQPVAQVIPVDWLDLRLGVVAAWSTGPIAQPFYTFRNGGTPTNHLNEPTTGRAIGTELDWAVRIGAGERGTDEAYRRWGRPQLAVQGGHAWMSDDLGGGRLDLLMASARATF